MPGGEGECVLCGGGKGEGHHQPGEGGQARQPRHQPRRQVQLRAEIYHPLAGYRYLRRSPLNSVADPYPHVFGPFGSLPFLIKVLNGLKECLPFNSWRTTCKINRCIFFTRM
jgi:hypothetical protein